MKKMLATSVNTPNALVKYISTLATRGLEATSSLHGMPAMLSNGVLNSGVGTMIKEKPYINHNIPKTKRIIQACFSYAFSTLGSIAPVVEPPTESSRDDDRARHPRMRLAVVRIRSGLRERVGPSRARR